MENRRSNDRLLTENTVVIQIRSFPHGLRPRRRSIECVTSDISEGGTRITLIGRYGDKQKDGDLDLLNRLEDGTRIDLAINFLRPRKRFKRSAIARWIRSKPGMPTFVIGLEFVGNSERAMRAWKRYIETNVPMGDNTSTV